MQRPHDSIHSACGSLVYSGLSQRSMPSDFGDVGDSGLQPPQSSFHSGVSSTGSHHSGLRSRSAIVSGLSVDADATAATPASSVPTCPGDFTGHIDLSPSNAQSSASTTGQVFELGSAHEFRNLELRSGDGLHSGRDRERSAVDERCSTPGPGHEEREPTGRARGDLAREALAVRFGTQNQSLAGEALAVRPPRERPPPPPQPTSEEVLLALPTPCRQRHPPDTTGRPRWEKVTPPPPAAAPPLVW